MISDDLKTVILGALKLDDWELNDSTVASEVPGWDSLSPVNVVLAVGTRFGVRFRQGYKLMPAQPRDDGSNRALV